MAYLDLTPPVFLPEAPEAAPEGLDDELAELLFMMVVYDNREFLMVVL